MSEWCQYLKYNLFYVPIYVWHDKGVWPPNFAANPTTAVQLPYSYNSIDNGDSWFYQQQSKTPVSHNTTFTLGTAANVHFEVGYDFLVGYPFINS